MSGASPASPVRYFFDEHVKAGVVAGLRRYGIDVLTAFEAGRANQKIADADQLTYSTGQHRVLVSNDTDFLDPHVVPQINTGAHAGIVYLDQTVSIGEQIRYLRFLYEQETAETLAGQISFYRPVPRGDLSGD